MTRYIFVTGGVLSSLGKGLASASIASLLQSLNFKVRIRKLDPYINFDPGTMNPYQHGEVFVTDDGAETDLDLGHYERFTGISPTKQDNTTAGRIYYEVIAKERRGDYGGGTVQVIPHITDAIKDFLTAGVDDLDFLICEIGGTVGDIEGLPFIEAIRQLGNQVGRENCLYIHLTLVPYVPTAQELKTKPAQHSVKELLSLGIQPDVLLCRCSIPLPLSAREKLSLFCNISLNRVIEAIDVKNIYEVPLALNEQGLTDVLASWFHFEKRLPADLTKWEKIRDALAVEREQINVALIGKYADLPDAYKSLLEALTHAGIANEVKVCVNWIVAEDLEKEGEIDTLIGMDAILVPGGFGERGTRGKIAALKFARENNTPCLGICFGMQMMVVEFATNVLKLEDAGSTEFANPKHPLVALLTEWQTSEGLETRSNAEDLGGTMRLGAYECHLAPESKAFEIYGNRVIHERHRHRWEVNTTYQAALEKGGLLFSGVSSEEKLPEIVEVTAHPWMIGVQFHPEFKSRPFEPHPLFVDYIKAAKRFKEVRDET